MRRMTTTPERLSPLAEALAAAPSAILAPLTASVDAEAMAGRERAAALDAARRDGLARGLANAEAEIAKRVEAIAGKLRDEHARAQDALQVRIGELRTLSAALADAVVVHRRDCQDAAVEAAFSALVRVLGDKAADRSLMPALCAQVLQSRGAGPVTLRLAPSDCALVDAGEDVRVVPDPALAAGRCVVETSRGGSDTGLDVRLDAVKNAFLEALALHREAP